VKFSEFGARFVSKGALCWLEANWKSGWGTDAHNQVMFLMGKTFRRQ
jgi:hypothetical protein